MLNNAEHQDWRTAWPLDDGQGEARLSLGPQRPTEVRSTRRRHKLPGLKLIHPLEPQPSDLRKWTQGDPNPRPLSYQPRGTQR